MSTGYAEKLSFRDDVGKVGQKELLDSAEDVLQKSKQLAELIKGAKRMVVMTGAGISTSAGIPDFRGPNGVWTCQKHGRPIPKLNTTFDSAKPSLTHMALLGLVRNGPLQYIVSQNVDGLHRRSGLAAEELAEVHGNCFMERCHSCNTYYLRDFEMQTVGFKPTGRACTKPRCRGKLRDFILDWEDALPDEQLEAAEEHASQADLMLCLGTSLQIRPICDLPLKTKRAGGSVCIVNLQRTPKHRQAQLVIHGRCDEVMRHVMLELGQPIPPFVRRDSACLSCWLSTFAEDGGEEDEEHVVLALGSTHGYACPVPMLRGVSWAASADSDELKVLTGSAAPPTQEATAAEEGAPPGRKRSQPDGGFDGIKSEKPLKDVKPNGTGTVVAAASSAHDRSGTDSRTAHWQYAEHNRVAPVLIRLHTKRICHLNTAQQSQAPATALYVRLKLHLSEAANEALRTQDLTLRVHLNAAGNATGATPRCNANARSAVLLDEAQQWAKALQTAAKLTYTTQVLVYDEGAEVLPPAVSLSDNNFATLL